MSLDSGYRLPSPFPFQPLLIACLPLPARLPACAEDRKARELIDTKNQADSMVYQTEKQVGAQCAVLLCAAMCCCLMLQADLLIFPPSSTAGPLQITYPFPPFSHPSALLPFPLPFFHPPAGQGVC